MAGAHDASACAANSRSSSRSVSSAARSISARTSACGSLNRPSTCAETIVGVGRVRAPDAGAHAQEVTAAETLLEALQPVVAGQPAAAAVAHLAEGQVDLVVHDDHLVEVELVADRGRGRPRGRTRSCRSAAAAAATRGAAGPARPSVTSAPNDLARSRQLPALRRARSRPRSRCCGACPRSATRGCRARRAGSRPGAPPPAAAKQAQDGSPP